MGNFISKSKLAIILSGLEGFSEPNVKKEQYLMDSEIGAEVIWNAFLLGEIKGKNIADFGCGTGLIGIAALLLGAKQVYFVDSDKKALEITKKNVSHMESESCGIGNAEFLCQNIEDFDKKVDVVIQNPPFGTKIKHIDALFLKKAVKSAPIVYSFHRRKTHRINVSCIRLSRQNQN